MQVGMLKGGGGCRMEVKKVDFVLFTECCLLLDR